MTKAGEQSISTHFFLILQFTVTFTMHCNFNVILFLNKNAKQATHSQEHEAVREQQNGQPPLPQSIMI